MTTSPTPCGQVHARFPEDLEVCTLFGEAIMNRTPWALWDLKTGGVAEGADTAEAVEVLEAAMEQEGAMAHPGLLHIYIHLMEMSPFPQRALKAGDALRSLAPDSGHLNHMPTHIDRIVRPLRTGCFIQRGRHCRGPEISRAGRTYQLLLSVPLSRLPLQDLWRDVSRSVPTGY